MFAKNIFLDIRSIIFPEANDHLSIREEHKRVLLAFLDAPSPSATLALYRFVSQVQRKEGVYDLMDVLRLYEKGLSEILPNHRDHYLHSASVYALGLAIYNRCAAIRSA